MRTHPAGALDAAVGGRRDIKGFFDNLDHDLLLARARERIPPLIVASRPPRGQLLSPTGDGLPLWTLPGGSS